MTQEVTTVRPVRASLVEHWDRTADVVVVGFGCAGAAAAIEASDAGASVLVLERAGGWGGASAISSGQIYLGGGTPVQQRRAASRTRRRRCTGSWQAVVGPGHDEAKLRLYCDGSVEHFDWLVGCGVPFKSVFYDGGYRPSVAEGGLMFSGGENAAPWDRIAPPAPRSHTPCVDDPHGERKGGWSLMSALVAEVSRRGADVAVRRARCGAGRRRRAASCGGRRSLTTAGTSRSAPSRGVVLTAGGFAFNDEMVRRHAPLIARCTRLGTDGDDGRAIRMAQAAGAAVKHMGASVERVRREGRRARAVDPGQPVRASASSTRTPTTAGSPRPSSSTTTGHRSWSLDEDTFERIDADSLAGPAAHLGLRRPSPSWRREMGLPGDALVNTVDLLQRARGGRRGPALRQTGDVAAAAARRRSGRSRCRSSHSRSSPLGGLDTTADGHVLDLDGAPIPGLYAAGRTTSGLAVSGYVSGLSLGDGTFFGRRAGRAAATG